MSLYLPNIENFYGVIIKKSPFGEGHSTVTLIDETKGKIEIFSFGSDREKSRRRSILMLSNIVKGVMHFSKTSSYWSIREVSLVKYFPNIPESLKKISFLYLLFEFIDLFLEYENIIPPNLFNNLCFTLEKLDKTDNFEKYIIYTILHLLKSEGILPGFESLKSIQFYLSEIGKNFKLGNGSIRFIRDIQRSGIYTLENKELSASVIENLLNFVSLIAKYEKGSSLNSLSLITFQ